MQGKLIETIHGKYNKFDITKDTGIFSNSFKLYKDGDYVSSFSRLDEAVASAKKRGGVS